MAQIYNHAYEEVSVYGNVMTLLRQYAGKQGVHVDIGCGYGAIAEPVRDELGLTYVGFDGADDGLDALRQRKFETHLLDLHDPVAAKAAITKALAGRPIASITLIDTLEHLINGRDILNMLRDLAGDGQAPLVISVPSAVHKDIAIKALSGRWDYTSAGLLDFTHFRCFTESSLTSLAAQAGWREVQGKDWLLETSDQYFPADFIPLKAGTPLGHLLRSFAGQSNPSVIVNQFVRAYLPAEKIAGDPFVTREMAPSAFATVVIRTQGRRIPQLQDALLSLAGQSVQDFNVLIVRHACTPEAGAAVAAVVEAFPASFKSRVKLIDCGPGSRGAPLNASLAHLAGQYVAFLDDDDFVFGHWIETFQKLSAAHPGKILRTSCALQYNSWLAGSPIGPHARPTNWFATPYPSHYDILQHLTDNHTPFMALAFPVSLFRDLRFRFDEGLPTAEDWELTIRAAQLCGVASDPSITAVYRWWSDANSSQTEHTQAEWLATRVRIIGRLNQAPVLLPPGSLAILGERMRQLDQKTTKLQVALSGIESTFANVTEADARLAAVKNTVTRLAADMLEDEQKAILAHRQQVAAMTAARAQLADLLNSSSWKVTKPLRAVVMLVRREKAPAARADDRPVTIEALEQQIANIRQSLSWRLTKPLRSAGTIFGGRPPP